MAEMVRLVQTGRKLGKLNQCPFRSVIPVNPNHDRYDRFFSLLLRPSLLLSVSPELSPPSFSVLLQISGRVSSISSLFVVSFLRRSDSSREAPDSSSSIFSAEICEDLRRHSSTTVVSLPSSSPPNQSFAASAPSCLSSCSVADLRFNLQSPSPSSSRLSSVKTREASSSATSQAVDETPVSGIFCPSLAVHQLRRKTRAPPEIASRREQP